MRSILYDELVKPEVEAVTDYLERHSVPSGIENLYWLPLPKELWNRAQAQGQEEEGWGDDEGGYRLAVEVGTDWVRFELLVRSESLLNIGGGLTDERQSMYILRWADQMAQKLNLISCGPASGSGGE